jgi:hypothetical protein
MKTLVVLLSLALGAVAWADDTHVRSSATVEVLDDKAQIDDVISRLRTQQQQQQVAPRDDAQPAAAAATQAATLKKDRPPAPTATGDGSHRAVGPEPKDQRPGSRRVNRERNGNPIIERPHPLRR